MQPITHTILQIFDNYRMAPIAIDEYEATGKTALANQIEKFTSSQQPISFAMLGLPFKSTNSRDKVLGELPDLGEELTIKNFEDFNNHVKSAYAPGVSIVVASDGYMFNDILGVSNQVVKLYKDITQGFKQNNTVDIIDVNDFYVSRDADVNREKIVQQFGFTWEKLEQEMLFNADVNMLYKGMIRFMEEELANRNFESNSQRHKTAKKLAREMMLRNEAYNQLVRHEMADHIRLTMHQSVNNGYKYSFKLIPGQNTQHSPWHSAVVIRGNEAMTMHRVEAEKAGYSLVYKDKQPYNFTAPLFVRDEEGNGNEWVIN
jgi:pyoverdine/dityrosine biosynthesis protein Dit1